MAEYETEFVAVVQVHRVTRRVIPAGTPVASSSRRTTAEERTTRDKSELTSFTIRSSSLPGVAQRMQAMIAAALPEAGVGGEPMVEVKEVEDDDF